MKFDYVDWYNSKTLNKSDVEVSNRTLAKKLSVEKPLQKNLTTLNTSLAGPKVISKMNITVLNRILNDSARVVPPLNQTKKGIIPKKIKKN